MSLNVNDFPVTNGDIIDSNNQVVNIVDLLGGGTPVSNQTLNKNDFPIHSGLVIGSDNKLYDLAQLISGGGTDVAEVEKIASTEVLFNEKLPIYEVIDSQYKTNTLLFVEGIEGYTQTVQLTITPTQSARISWGDGSNLDFITEETTLTHTYEKEGKYIIKIESPSSRVYILSGNAIVLTNCNLVKAQFGSDCNVRNGLSFPAQDLIDLYAKGQADFNFSIFQHTKLKEFYINNIDSSVTIPNDSFRYSTIEKITISDNFKTFGNRVFPNNIKEIYIETDPSNPHINFTFNEYTFANISEYTPVYIPYGTKAYFETNLPYFKTYIEVVDDVAKELHKKLDTTGGSLTGDVTTTNTTFTNTSFVTKNYVDTNTLQEAIVDVNVLPTGSNIKDVVYRLTTDNPETIPGETTTVAFNSSTTDVDLFTPTLESTGLFNIISSEDEMMMITYYAYSKNSQLRMEFDCTTDSSYNIPDSRINEIRWGEMGNIEVSYITDTAHSIYLTGQVGTFTFTQPSTIVHHYTYSYYMGDSTNQTTTELSSSPTEPTAQEIEVYEADILSVIS